MRGRSWLSIVSGAILNFLKIIHVLGVFFLKMMMLWFSPSHRKDSENFSIFGNKKSYIKAQALNSWVTIGLKKVTNLFEISLFP